MSIRHTIIHKKGGVGASYFKLRSQRLEFEATHDVPKLHAELLEKEAKVKNMENHLKFQKMRSHLTVK